MAIRIVLLDNMLLGRFPHVPSQRSQCWRPGSDVLLFRSRIQQEPTGSNWAVVCSSLLFKAVTFLQDFYHAGNMVKHGLLTMSRLKNMGSHHLTSCPQVKRAVEFYKKENMGCSEVL